MIVCAGPVLARNGHAQAVERCVGETLTPQDRVRGCSALIRSSRRGDPDLGAYYFYRAHGYWTLREFEKAETDINRAMTADRGWGQFMLRGDIRAARGNFAGAIDDFTAASQFVRETSATNEQAKTNWFSRCSRAPRPCMEPAGCRRPLSTSTKSST